MSLNSRNLVDALRFHIVWENSEDTRIDEQRVRVRHSRGFRQLPFPRGERESRSRVRREVLAAASQKFEISRHHQYVS